MAITERGLGERTFYLTDEALFWLHRVIEYADLLSESLGGGVIQIRAAIAWRRARDDFMDYFAYVSSITHGPYRPNTYALTKELGMTVLILVSARHGGYWSVTPAHADHELTDLMRDIEDDYEEWSCGQETMPGLRRQ